ncbi:hypothetical protein [Nocardioides sp.]|uniref:hypothetical protein n=1 Tax=Nocardioides sp. TaxID=35761 RepID=UPI00351722CD
MSAPRVMLHVGSPKTGTTFIQQTLWGQREVAAAHGVHLPMNGFHDHFWATLDVRGVAGKAPHPPESEGAWNRLVTDTRRHTGTVLISHELFAIATETQAHNAVGWFGTDLEVHLVVTARDLLRQVTAEWQEHVKHRNTLTLEEFVEREVRGAAADRSSWFWKVQDTADVVRRWSRRLPAARVHVVTVPAHAEPGDDLWTRFARVIGLPATAFDTTAGRANSSLGQEQAELLRRVNGALGERLPFPGPYPAVAKDILAHASLASRPGTRLGLREEDARFAAQHATRIAEELADLGVDVVGSLSDLVPDDAAVAAAIDPQAYREIGDAEIVEEGVAAIADLLVELSETRRREADLAHELRELRRAPLRTVLDAAEPNAPTAIARSLYRRIRPS